MIRTVLLTALISGFLAGIAISVVQAFTTTPIILHAEQYENAGAAGRHAEDTSFARIILAHGTETHAGEPQSWAPADGLERTLFTTLANVLAGIGFALILAACLALAGRPVDGRSGVLWGMAGFAVFTLAPGLGLPPEVPGSMSADLFARQGWWFLCVGATALGLWLLVFRTGALWIPLGIAAIAAPHLIGAPQPERIGGAVPPELAGHFAAASIATAAIFWAILGWLSGATWQYLHRT